MRIAAALTRTKVFTTATLRPSGARKCLNIHQPRPCGSSESRANPRSRVRFAVWSEFEPGQNQQYKALDFMGIIVDNRSFSCLGLADPTKIVLQLCDKT